MYLENYIQLWKDLAQQHIPSFDFYRLNHNEMNDAIRNKIQYPMLQLEEYDGVLKKNSPTGTKFNDRQNCAIIITNKINKGDYDDEQTKLKDLKKWGAQLFARILEKDMLQEYCPNSPMSIDESAGIKYFLTDWMADNSRGWRIEFELISEGKEMIYDPTQWQI